ncbi:MAG: preprotein translocase subunit YajC [Lachnospiraceae bacterium]|nr:preprotein translocase subunit YajC [Lachnospiraceae bacterium]
MGGIWGIILYVVVIGAIFYLMLYRPQKKQQQKTKAMLDQLEVGDSVLTTSGFYGVVIDITDDTVIVEFGNNKNCRIPMQKSAITQLEKPEA